MRYITPEISAIQSDRTMVETALRKVDVALTALEDINKLLEQSKINFIDGEFPPEDASIVGHSDRNLIDDTINHWRRPVDIYSGNYQLIDKLNHHHMTRGKLGDNSFYSVVAALTLFNPSLIERLFYGATTINPLGVYRLRFCKNGEWQSVTIDDLIPCEPRGNPKFASSSVNEIWFNLLQKAYAKLHRCYLQLHDLEVGSVFSDLTGCPTYIIPMGHPEITTKIRDCFEAKLAVVFFNNEEKEFDEDEFIPLKNYAYPLLGFGPDEDGETVFTLIGHSHEEERLGEEELLKKFRFMCVCHAKNWEEVRIKGKFITAETGTEENRHPISMSRWYYSLDLPQASEVHVGLHQEDMLVGTNQLFKPYAYCSFLILEKSDKSLLKTVTAMPFAHNREIQLKMQLQAGTYLVVPFINSESAIKKAPNEEEQIVDIFRKLDLLMRRELKYPELVPFFKVCSQVFDEEVFNELLKQFARGRRGIGLLAFREMWAKNRIYWKDCLEYYEKERLFTLSIHSSVETNILIKNNIGTEYDNRAHCDLLSKEGENLATLNKTYEKYAKIKFLKSRCHIVEYMVENRHDRKIEVDFECTESTGYYFVPSSGRVTLTLDSGQKLFLMKLIPYEKSEVKDLRNVERVRVKTFD